MAVLAVLCAACALAPQGPSTIDVSTESFPWTDLGRYRTYRWWRPPLGPTQGASEREQLIDWYVRRGVDEALHARGYVEDVAGAPDFVVRYGVAVREDSTSSFQDYLEYRAGGGGKDMGEAFMGYDRGTLAVSLLDVATRRTAWRATASAIVETDTRGKRVEQAVREMMAQLPATAHAPGGPAQ